MKDAFPANPATFGGIVARMADDGRSVHAVATLVDAGTLALVATYEARVQVDVDGDALPALLEALAGLPGAPDIVLAEGLETAVRFGAAAELPCIGIGIAIPPGLRSRTELHDMRGAFTPLRAGDVQVAWLLRSRVGAPPIAVAPGHRIALPSAPELVMRCVRGDRLPEPLRLAIAAFG